ncbi:helix-turn-helix domain-containing protein [Pseudomonas sp. MRSN 12121]|uniref:helix-turn-helix domain-containing protein n=1 Tax=Pseudomonas sp. MRSN 12121 TaxID=1611770 RepID=UPI0006965EC0|nr:AraC family transcriptional regulator [Pseudomonas sp. MRSN 12121]
MKKENLIQENNQPIHHPSARSLDLAGIVYDTDCKLVTHSTQWSFGRTDRIVIEGLHDVTVARSEHTIVLFEDGENERGQATLDGKPVYRRGTLRGKMDLIPKDAEYISTYVGPPIRLTTISFSEELISLMPSRRDLFHIKARFYMMDKFLVAACGEFVKTDSSLLKETLALTILSHSTLLQTESSHSGVGALSKHLKDLLSDYIEEHLDTEIKIADLAELSQISTFHFIRLFRNSFNLTPYQYIIQRRLIRAEVLLVHTMQPIIDIALACGFQGASQFSYAFKKNKGVSPIEFRRRQSLI